MQNRLFIGGAQDGINIPVANDIEFVQLPVGDTGLLETYIRDTLAVGYVSFVFYRHESLTPEQVLDLLAKHYKAWAVNQPDSRT